MDGRDWAQVLQQHSGCSAISLLFDSASGRFECGLRELIVDYNIIHEDGNAGRATFKMEAAGPGERGGIAFELQDAIFIINDDDTTRVRPEA